jgi:carboxyl-terminal processing protease
MRTILFSLLLVFHLASFGQAAREKTAKEVTKYLKEIINVIKENGLYADSINWNDLEGKVSSLSKGMQHTEDCTPVIDTILNTLRSAGDKHSVYYDKKAAKKLTSSNYVSKPVESRLVGDNIGYIKVPMFLSIDLSASETFASDIQNQIRQLDEGHNIQGWIVDLRGNSGGNMHPMIKGLSSLIGDSIYVYVLYPKRTLALSTVTGQTAYIKLNSSYRTRSVTKIAVLIDSLTGSSGEFTAIAFKTQPNTLFFGQPTAGYTTSNQSFKLKDGSYLFLATAYMADRKGNKYLPNIIPDVIVPPNPDKNNDPTVEAARNWLHSK